MAIKKPLIEKPFTNEFGTVNVGDTVMAVTTGYSHSVSVNKGKYIGYIESQDWRGNTTQKVKLEVLSYRNAWYYKGTDNEWKWNYTEWRNGIQEKLESRQIPYTRKTTLKLNRIAPIKDSDIAIVDTVAKLV